MQSPCGFANVEIQTVPTTSFIYNFGHLRTVEPVFVGEKRLDAMCVLCVLEITLPALNENISSEKLYLN